MNDFARKQLEKYGWANGKGLGKREDGIVNPVKAKLKLNSQGVGFDSGEQFKFNWWEHVFNSAAKNLSVDNDEVGNVMFKSKVKDKVKIQSKRPIKFAKKDLHLGSFVKSEILTADGLETCNDKPKLNSDSEDSIDGETLGQQRLTEEELFIKCGGLTAHKGARHGLRMSGKLSRVEKQDKEFNVEMKENSQDEDVEMPNVSGANDNCEKIDVNVKNKKRSRKRKRKRKSSNS